MANVLLITGANSYVAGQVIKLALERGYAVHGTVRSQASGEKLLASFPEYSSKLTFGVVPDMTKADAYATSFEGRGITGVIHTASPFSLEVKDNTRDLLTPARDGALAILEAVRKFGGGSVKSVVNVSSFASVVDVTKGLRPGYTYTEADWNPMTWDEAAAADAVSAYCASKALAEKAMWKWVDEQKQKADGAVTFTLTNITPPWVFGPYANLAGLGIKSTAQLNESMKILSRLVDGSLAGGAVPPTDFAAFIDVRDLAKALLTAYERADDPAIGGQRFLTGSKFSYQTACDVIRDAFPQLKDKVPVGTPGSGRTEPTYVLDTTKARTTLPIEFTPIEQTVRDSIEQIATLL